MRAQLVAALRAVLVFTILTGLAYPLVVTGVAQLAFGLDDERDWIGGGHGTLEIG